MKDDLITRLKAEIAKCEADLASCDPKQLPAETEPCEFCATYKECIEALEATSLRPLVDLSNHHNALTCAYCNPMKLELFGRDASLRPQEEQPNAEIEAVWSAIQNGYDIEPRAYFEEHAPKNGFRYPLAQAIHHIWKREPKVVEALRREEPQEDERLREIQSDHEADENSAWRTSHLHKQRGDLLSMLRARVTPGDPPPWQPIATAPENKRLLAWYPIGNAIYIGRSDCGHFYGPGGEEPTHWMPLPFPPASAPAAKEPKP